MTLPKILGWLFLLLRVQLQHQQHTAFMMAISKLSRRKGARTDGWMVGRTGGALMALMWLAFYHNGNINKRAGLIFKLLPIFNLFIVWLVSDMSFVKRFASAVGTCVPPVMHNLAWCKKNIGSRGSVLDLQRHPADLFIYCGLGRRFESRHEQLHLLSLHG